MRLILALPAFVLMGSWAQAEPKKLDGAEIKEALAEQTIYSVPGAEQSQQVFQSGGATYFQSHDAQSQGAWKVEDDKYCSTWEPNPNWTCYDVLRDGSMISFVAPSGKRTDYALTK